MTRQLTLVVNNAPIERKVMLCPQCGHNSGHRSTLTSGAIYCTKCFLVRGQTVLMVEQQITEANS